jgi:hypothetical protein
MYLRPAMNPGWVVHCFGGEIRVYDEERWAKQRDQEPLFVLTERECWVLVAFLRAWLGEPRDDPTRLAEGLHVSFKLFEPYELWPE